MNIITKTPVAIPVSKLHFFEGHPYKILDNDEMTALIESIQAHGILSPLIVRPKDDRTDEYEVVSGHRRLYAAAKAGLETVPAFIHALDRDEAAIALVDSNLHREHILPSEKAFAYKMKLDAIKHQGLKLGITSRQVVGKSESADLVSANESGRTIQRYICLTRLIPQLLSMMDESKIALSVGVELSFLPEQFQQDVLEFCEMNDSTPSYSQSWHLHRYNKEGKLDRALIFTTLSAAKANQHENVKVSMERLRGIIPANYTVKETEDFLVKAADYYTRYLHRQRERER